MAKSRRLHLGGNDYDHQLVKDQMAIKNIVGFGGGYNPGAIIDPACITCKGKEKKDLYNCDHCPGELPR